MLAHQRSSLLLFTMIINKTDKGWFLFSSLPSLHQIKTGPTGATVQAGEKPNSKAKKRKKHEGGDSALAQVYKMRSEGIQPSRWAHGWATFFDFADIIHRGESLQKGKRFACFFATLQLREREREEEKKQEKEEKEDIWLAKCSIRGHRKLRKIRMQACPSVHTCFFHQLSILHHSARR